MMKINKDKCIGCSLCINDCIVNDIVLIDGKADMKNTACFKCGHCIAICPKEAVSTDDYKMEEVKAYDKETFTLDPEHLLNFIQFRRSTRHFKAQEVEKEKLMKIIEAGRFTQTATNAQNVSYVIVTDELSTLRSMVFETLNAMGTQMLADPNLDAKFKFYAQMWINMYKAYKLNPTHDKVFFNAPAVILTVSPSEVNATLAASNMELMTNALGLGTFFSGFFTKAAEVNSGIKTFLGLKETDAIVNCMVIGYPSVKYARTTPRKEAEIIWK